VKNYLTILWLEVGQRSTVGCRVSEFKRLVYGVARPTQYKVKN